MGSVLGINSATGPRVRALTETFAVAGGLSLLAGGVLATLASRDLLPDAPFLLFLLPVVISGVYGGRRCAVAATVVSAALADFFFLPPFYTFVNGDWHQDAKLGLYLLDGLTLAAVCGRLRSQREVERRRDEAERANAYKSAFLANMSHEIRTPLGAILGYAELLRDEPDAEQCQRFIDTILRNGRALNRLVDDVLDLAKVEANRLELERVDFALDQVILDVVDLFREAARAKGLFLTVEDDGPWDERLISDPTRLRQILINVLGNAVKFTARGGVTIEVGREPRGSRQTLVSLGVRDTGIGLTAAQAAGLFEPFAQAAGATERTHGGTGLGLSISRRLARALGGDVRLADPAAGGSTFVITFLAEVVTPSGRE